MIGIEFAGLPRDYLKTWPEKVAAVTREDVRRAAQAHLRPGAATILALGDGEALPPALERFGPLRPLVPR